MTDSNLRARQWPWTDRVAKCGPLVLGAGRMICDLVDLCLGRQ
ncbi:hypothetical protein [Nocardia nova]|nr:hypothetical protein [Nocardia nova]